jgi:DNA polymerase I
MIQLYITNTQTVYEPHGIYIDLWGRTEEKKLEKIRVGDFEPYFFVRRKVAEDINPNLHDGVDYVEADCGEESLMGDPLGKVVAEHPGAVSDLREKWDDTWEADVVFTNRLRIDEDIKTGVQVDPEEVIKENVNPFRDEVVDAVLKGEGINEEARAVVDEIVREEIQYVPPAALNPVEMSVEEHRLTFDIEVDDSNGFPTEGEERIISVVAHSNYGGETIGFIDRGGEPADEFFGEDALPENLDTLYHYDSEREMLVKFAKFLSNIDPDLLVGWNSNGFDVPYLIDRMNKLGIDPDRLARGDGGVDKSYGTSIDGRVSYDLMDAWVSTKFTEPDSKKLDHAASVELDDAKLDYDEGGVMELYYENPQKLLEYNTKDVVLTHRVGEEAVYDFKRRLRNIVGVDWDETIENNDFVEMMVRRKLYRRNERGPTKTPPSDGRNDYEGAYTLDAYTGVAENVVEIDLSSLYPMTIWMLNASPETKVPASEAKNRDNVAKAPNGVYYDLTEEGLFKSLVNDALELKRTYKEDIQNAEPSSEEEAEAEEAYAVAKTIVNSIYGVTGWEWFFLYDRQVAESITLMSQQVTRRTEKWVNENTEGEVIYGDTDSCYISFPDSLDQKGSLHNAERAVQKLNGEIFPDLAEQYGMGSVECRWEMELEKYCSSFFQAGKKKRYAYLKTWKDGMDYDDTIEEFDVTGFEAVRSDCAQITEDLQLTVLEDIVRGSDTQEIAEVVHEHAKKIQPKPDDWEYIGIPRGIGKQLHNYDSDTAQVKGAKNANRYLGLNIGEGDKPYRCYLENSTVSNGKEQDSIEVVCYENNYEVQKEGLNVNVGRMQKTVVRRPMEPILSAIEMDAGAAIRGQIQQGLKSFM